MDNDAGMIREMLGRGECCGQIIMRLGLALRGVENEDMVRAASGLCLGAHSGYLCGTLGAAAQVLALFDPKNAARHMIPRLMEWFDDEYGGRFASPNCVDITGGSPRLDVCRDILTRTWEQVRLLLAEFGFEVR